MAVSNKQVKEEKKTVKQQLKYIYLTMMRICSSMKNKIVFFCLHSLLYTLENKMCEILSNAKKISHITEIRSQTEVGTLTDGKMDEVECASVTCFTMTWGK